MSSTFTGELVDLNLAEGSCLNGATFGGTKVSRCAGWQLIARGARLTRANLNHSRFDYAVMDGAHMDGASLIRASMHESSFEGASFEGANLLNTSARRSGFERCNFSSAELVGVKFDECRLDGADFSSADLTGLDLTKCTITGATFDDAIVTGLVVCADQLIDAPSLLERFLRMHIDAKGGLRAVLASGPVISPNFELTNCELVELPRSPGTTRGQAG